MRGWPALLVALALACGGSEKPPLKAPRHLSPAEVARRSLPSVVGVITDRGFGTGFVIAADGLIATNFHVIRGARQLAIVTSEQETYKEVLVAGFDPAHDLALLRVRDGRFPPLRFRRSELEVGERVVVIGHPRGLANTVSDGLVSGIRHLGPGNEVIQMSAPISPGSSGGPVLDDRGKVIGVSTKYSPEGNLNFAVPIRYVEALAGERAEEIPITRLPDDRARRYFDGCSAADIVTIHLALERTRRKGLELGKKGRHRDALEHYRLAAADLILRVPRCRNPRHDLLRAAAQAERAPSDAKAASSLHSMMNAIAAELKKALR